MSASPSLAAGLEWLAGEAITVPPTHPFCHVQRIPEGGDPEDEMDLNPFTICTREGNFSVPCVGRMC